MYTWLSIELVDKQSTSRWHARIHSVVPVVLRVDYKRLTLIFKTDNVSHNAFLIHWKSSALQDEASPSIDFIVYFDYG